MIVCFIVYVLVSCKMIEIRMKMVVIVVVFRVVFGMLSGWLEWVEIGIVLVVVFFVLVCS